MREELDKKLCEKYPKIFADRHKSMTQTAMCWGFDVGDGWYNIIDLLCANIQWHIDETNKTRQLLLDKNPYNLPIPDEVQQVVASQVKEKFGGLRFYYNGGDDIVRALVSFADTMSYRTCETCGSPGKRRGGGWIYTACDAHTRQEDLEEEQEDADMDNNAD
jgi:hypothetical protein